MIPRTLYDSDHEMFRQSVRKFIETHAIPNHEMWEKEGMVSDKVWLDAGSQGFLCPTVAEKYEVLTRIFVTTVLSMKR